MSTSVRWAFNLSKWEPSEKEFLLASSCLQIEDKQRIDKFVFRKDVKSSLIGRLMIRKFVSEYTEIPYNSIELITDANGKPIYKTSGTPTVSFNVSHQGSYTVFVGETGNKDIGVDVMKLEYTGGKNLQEFFRIMNRNFTATEWNKINRLQNTEQNKIAMFCRHWALKESYIKAVGVGLSMGLNRINFDVKSDLHENKVTLDTVLSVDNEKVDWIFEESLIDPYHCVAVALERQKYNFDSSNNPLFETINIDILLDKAIPVLPQDFEYCKKYFSKDQKP